MIDLGLILRLWKKIYLLLGLESLINIIQFIAFTHFSRKGKPALCDVGRTTLFGSLTVFATLVPLVFGDQCVQLRVGICLWNLASNLFIDPTHDFLWKVLMNSRIIFNPHNDVIMWGPMCLVLFFEKVMCNRTKNLAPQDHSIEECLKLLGKFSRHGDRVFTA